MSDVPGNIGLKVNSSPIIHPKAQISISFPYPLLKSCSGAYKFREKLITLYHLVETYSVYGFIFCES